jgi:bifunctional UDP-N-acetylglucosamine pyrophosphorylase/glucosamine-1-phosphate N-acetyltransferase
MQTIRRKCIVKSKKDFNNLFGVDSEIFYKDKSTLIFHKGVEIEPNVIFEGHVVIKDGCRIGSGSHICNSTLEKNVVIKSYSILNISSIGQNSIIGPFAYIRDNTKIRNNSIVGAYVECARSIIHDNVKISHRAFIGDVEIKSNSIIGASVVFCNYNHNKNKKFKSIVGKDTLVGSNVTLISPVKIGSGCVIGASSLINKDVRNNSKIIQKR